MIKHILFLLIGFFGLNMANAQIKVRSGNEDTLRNKMTIVVNYKPTIVDAKKRSESPSVIDSAVAKPAVRYMYNNQKIQTFYTPDTIKAAKMKGESLDPLYRGYAKVGAGNGINYLADVHVNSLRSRDGSIGFSLNGFGTQGNISSIPHPAPFNHWNSAVYGKKFFKKHAFDAKFAYDRERLFYYGFDETNPIYAGIEPNIQDEVFKQVFNDWSVDMNLKSFYTDSSKVNHTVHLKYNFFSDLNMANVEHNPVLTGNINTYLGEHLFDLDMKADFNALGYGSAYVFEPYDTIAQLNSNFIADIHPKFISQSKKLRIEIGLHLQAELSSVESDPFIYPDVNLKYNLVKEIIIPYLGLKGGFGRGLSRNNMNSLTEENPFLWTNLTPLLNNREVYNVKGGFRGSVSNRLTYNLFGAAYKVENTPLFVNYNSSQFNTGINRFGENFFTVIYDTVSTTEIGGELTYRVDEKLQIVASGVYRSFEVKNELKAWQLPNVEVHSSAFYQLRNKIILKGQVHFYGPRWSKSYVTTENDLGYDELEDKRIYGEKMSSIFDLSLGVEYRYTERLSGFLNMNNLVAQKYQYWNQYPVQRFNVMAGITFSFWKE